MRKVHEQLDTILNTHAEMAGATSPEAQEVIRNLRQDLTKFLEDVIHAARGQESDLIID